MAIIRVHNDLVDDPDFFTMFYDQFDSVVEIKRDGSVTTFRVNHEEIPKNDAQIDPLFMRFDGIKPFVIEWDI